MSKRQEVGVSLRQYTTEITRIIEGNIFNSYVKKQNKTKQNKNLTCDGLTYNPTKVT